MPLSFLFQSTLPQRERQQLYTKKLMFFVYNYQQHLILNTVKTIIIKHTT